MARGSAADAVNGCQLVSHIHAKKNLKRNENINLILNIKHLLSQNIAKHVSSYNRYQVNQNECSCNDENYF